MNYPCNGLILHLSHTETGKTQVEDQACFAEFQVFMPSSARLQQSQMTLNIILPTILYPPIKNNKNRKEVDLEKQYSKSKKENSLHVNSSFSCVI